MNLLFTQKSRCLWLKGFTFTLIVILIYIFLKPEKDRFADMPGFQNWESIDTDKLKELNSSDLVYGKRLQEVKNHNFAIDVLLFPAFNNSNLKLIELYLGYKLKSKDLTIFNNKDFGSYGLFTKNNSTYLSTCLHPQGKVAFTQQHQAELANNNLHGRILPWILGLSDLRDWRCFWINMSVDLDSLTEQEAIRLLQNKLLAIISTNNLR